MGDPKPAEAPTLVVIAGPIASGKSTVARALCTELRRHGELVALVELDQIAGMALPTLPSWNVAHAIFNSVVGQWLRTSVTCVVAEGSGSPTEVKDLVNRAPLGTRIVRVVLTSPFDVAFSRAQADPTRGVSRQRAFLTGEYERWRQDLLEMERHVFIDTAETSVERSVALITATILERSLP